MDGQDRSKGTLKINPELRGWGLPSGAPAARPLAQMPSYDSVAQQLSRSLQSLFIRRALTDRSKLGAPTRQGTVATMRLRYAA